MKRVIHWFRRDLRITDNAALHAAGADAEEIVPVYVLSTWKGSHCWTGPNRQEFLCGCLRSLAANLREIGGALSLREGDPVQALAALIDETRASALYYNRDPDPAGRAMETRVRAMAESKGCQVNDCKDCVLHERDEVLTGAGTPFQVFTAYSRAWRNLPKAKSYPRLRRLSTPSKLRSLPLPALERWGLARAAAIVEPGEKAARARMRSFLSEPILRYGEARDIPSGQTTSRLSQDLRFGLISIRELYRKCAELSGAADAAGRKSIQRFINELVWREFYMQILWHYPEVLDLEFNLKHRGLRWGHSTAPFERWKTGATGFPIVDAGMRQLQATGFMHNRLRMITAMFLTKDLHLDWRLGERYFMQMLVDGEIASNNGGWQWSAGCGADAAPYFRIQNPWLQGKRFDPEGEFIKEWVPELRSVAPARLHRPPEGLRIAKDYPLPMVDHAKEREAALEMFRPGST